MQLSVDFGSQQLSFTVGYSARKTMAISVYPDLRIEVRAPCQALPEQIKKKVKKRAPWILHQLDYFESFLPRTPQRNYVSGETHKYLGKQYQLKVVLADDESVKLQTGYIVVSSYDTSSIRVRQLLTRWYYNQAKKKIQDRYDALLPNFKKYGLEAKQLRFKRMDARWGSCNVKQAVVLNPELIKATTRCIDYVIIHELCHVKHHNHGAKFYQMIDIMMPDWQKWKQRLEQSMV